MKSARSLEFLACEHFAAAVDEVAHDLVGRTLRVTRGTDIIDALIVETEAYGGAEDAASHAAFRPGGRARMMLERAGTIYVYTAYGMYPCLNIVTGQIGQPSAVLLRGALLDYDQRLVSGPGRLGRTLQVTVADNGLDCAGPEYQVSQERREFRILHTPRIGITRATDTLWRFVAELE